MTSPNIAYGHPILDSSDEISKGNFKGQTFWSVAGYNSDVNGTEEDLWNQGGSLSYLSAASTMSYAAGAGDTGTLFVSGNLAGVEVTETRTLNEGTPVAGSQLFDTINFMFISAGATNINNITATADSDASVQCNMLAGRGITQHGFYRMPTGYGAIIKQVEFSAVKESGGQDPIIEFKIYARFSSASPWIIILDRRINAATTSDFVLPFPLSGPIGPGADVRLSASSTEVNTQALMRVIGIRYKV